MKRKINLETVEVIKNAKSFKYTQFAMRLDKQQILELNERNEKIQYKGKILRINEN